MISDPIGLETANTRAHVYRTGALLTDVMFHLRSGIWVQPLALPTWPHTQQQGTLGHMRRLGGEFFCLPFGGTSLPHDSTAGWEDFVTEPANPLLHGPCANDDWTVVEAGPDHITLRLDFPSNHALSHVERRISLSADHPKIDITVDITARRSTRVAAAFHPILRLPEKAGALKLQVKFAQGFTYPGTIESDSMVTEPGREFHSINSVPQRGGGVINLSKLPLGPAMEDVVLMAGIDGPLHADFINEGFRVVLDWSHEHLPHCMMWIHDRGIAAEPWANQYRGLGLEPMAAAFDGPWSLSVKPNPLTNNSFPTALRVDPDVPTTLFCSISVE